MTASLARPESLPDTPRAEHATRRFLTLPVAARVLLALSLLLWLSALHALRTAPDNQYGLLASTGGPSLLVATLGVAVAFGLAVRADSMGDAVAALVAFIAVTRATATLITDLPLFTWTFKHIGVIDHLSTTGRLARNIDIYNNWPGFFSAATWFSDVTGVPFVTVAHWFPVVCDAAIVLGMYALSRAFGHSVAVSVVAGFGIQAFNWVGQDYYSPQAVAFVLAIAVLALMLRSRTNPRIVWFTVPLFVAITATHQLTPFWLCGVAVLLGLTRQIRPRWLALIYIVVAIGFALANLKALSPYGVLTGFDPLSNAQSNVPTAGSAGRSFTSLATRGTSGLMWLSAAVCAVRARRRREPVWVPAVLAFTSFALLAGQSYGGEAIFRVFLYSMPGCLLLIAPVLTTAMTDTFSRRDRGAERPQRVRQPRVRRLLGGTGRLATLGLALVITVASMQAYYGTFFVNVVDRSGLAVQQQLLDTAPTDSLIVPLALGIAERPNGRYVDFARVDPAYDHSLILLPGVQSSSFGPAEVQSITDGYVRAGRPVYLIITAQMRRYCDYYGLFPAGAVDRLVRALLASDRWTTMESTASVSVFRLVRS